MKVPNRGPENSGGAWGEGWSRAAWYPPCKLLCRLVCHYAVKVALNNPYSSGCPIISNQLGVQTTHSEEKENSTGYGHRQSRGTHCTTAATIGQIW